MGGQYFFILLKRQQYFLVVLETKIAKSEIPIAYNLVCRRCFHNLCPGVFTAYNETGILLAKNPGICNKYFSVCNNSSKVKTFIVKMQDNRKVIWHNHLHNNIRIILIFIIANHLYIMSYAFTNSKKGNYSIQVNVIK